MIKPESSLHDISSTTDVSPNSGFHRLLLLWMIWVFPACLGACGRETPSLDANVIIVVIDTLRSDRLTAYGADENLNPGMDRLAEEGVYFRRAVAPSSWTKPSVASLMTGLYPGQHGSIGTPWAFEGLAFLDRKYTTLAERLKSAGYMTAAFVSNPHIISHYHFDQGFDRFVEPAGDAEELMDKALDWIDDADTKEDKFFLYLHLIDPHTPYYPPEKYRNKYVKGEPGDRAPFTKHGNPTEIALWAGQFQAWRPTGPDDRFRFDYSKLASLMEHKMDTTLPDLPPDKMRALVDLDFTGLDDPALLKKAEYLVSLYDGEVVYTDDVVTRLCDALRGKGLFDDTILVVTSDHGEAFLEHGTWWHGVSVHAEEVDIPLIISIPDSAHPLKGCLEKPVSLLDLYPTILDMLGLPVPSGLGGVSLWPAIWKMDESVLPERPIFSESTRKFGDFVAAILDMKKLIRVSKPDGTVTWLYYDIEADPGEQKPLDPAKGGRTAKELMRQIELLLKNRKLDFASKSVENQFSEEELKELRALGYF